MAGYIAYVSHPNDKAVMHNAACSFARVATGALATGHWLTGFGTRAQAQAAARGTGKKLVKNCHFC